MGRGATNNGESYDQNIQIDRTAFWKAAIEEVESFK